MRKYNPHPMAAMNRQHMGGWLDDIKNWADDTYKSIVDPIEATGVKILQDAGIPQDQIDKIKLQAQEDALKEVQKLEASVAKQIIGTQPAPAPSTSVLSNAASQIDALNKSKILSYIPGGIYTLAGVGVLVVGYMLMTRD